MEHANDHFLADVAPFGKADGARFNTGLDRDRLRVHVDAEFRDAGFDSQRFGAVGVELDHAGAGCLGKQGSDP